MEQTDLDKLVNEEKEKIKQEQQITGQDMANAIINAAQEPEKMLRVAVSNQIATKVKTDQSTIDRIDKSADKLVNSGVTTIENEAEASQNKSEREKLQTYFDKHKEELKTAGIDQPTYLEEMERGVKWHKWWSNIHWVLFGWWLTGIRTFIMKAKPFKIVLNILAIIISVAALVGAGFGLAALIRLIAH